MKKEVSIVKVDTRPYRTIAKENWGLTKQQMKGMHVHHRIKRSEGGTNDPSNLYVCSAWFHLNVWHDGTIDFIPHAVEAGRRGGKKGGEIGGPLLKQMEKGIFDPENKQKLQKWGAKGGKIGGKMGDRKGKAVGAAKFHAQVWESTVDGFRSNASAVANHNRAKGWDPRARVRIK